MPQIQRPQVQLLVFQGFLVIPYCVRRRRTQPLTLCWVACATFCVSCGTKLGRFDIPEIHARTPKWRPHIFLQGFVLIITLSLYSLGFVYECLVFVGRLVLFCGCDVFRSLWRVSSCGIFVNDFENILVALWTSLK